MGYWAMNERSDHSSIRYELYNEHINGDLFIATIGGKFEVAFSEPGEWLYWWLVANRKGQDGHIVVCPFWQKPQQPIRRVMGTWGTEPKTRKPMIQQQVDRVVQFKEDYNFYNSSMTDMTTNGKFKTIPNRGGWPSRAVSALYWRCEATRTDEPGPMDISFAAWSANGEENAAFITRARGLCQKVGDHAFMSHDGIRHVMDPQEDSFAIQVPANVRANIYLLGYELISGKPEIDPSLTEKAEQMA